MATYELIPHPEHPPHSLERVAVQVFRTEEGGLEVIYMVEPSNEVVIPDWDPGERADQLWSTTCFELFARLPGGDRYLEFNFSPSGKWAAYEFDGYRAGMRNAVTALDPDIRVFTDPLWLFAEPWPASLVADASAFALSAVIEETDGTKSYWALHHAPGPPDFHNPACFTATLPPPDRA